MTAPQWDHLRQAVLERVAQEAHPPGWRAFPASASSPTSPLTRIESAVK